MYSILINVHKNYLYNLKSNQESALWLFKVYQLIRRALIVINRSNLDSAHMQKSPISHSSIKGDKKDNFTPPLCT